MPPKRAKGAQSYLRLKFVRSLQNIELDIDIPESEKVEYNSHQQMHTVTKQITSFNESMSSDTDTSRQASPSPHTISNMNNNNNNNSKDKKSDAPDAAIPNKIADKNGGKLLENECDVKIETSDTTSVYPGDGMPADDNNDKIEKTTPKKEIIQGDVSNMTSARRASPQPMETENRTADSPAEEAVSRKNSPIPGKLVESKGHPERKRRASTESGDSAMTKTSEGKEDEDEEDNDDDEKMPVGQDIDPERLKAFNMFVRLFVDENLDRIVPISKQPKDKIQAILEACDRQFPEFHERSRKRIRTYLKSCRRMRKSKEHNGWEPLRPTPPHLTSAAAEGILASACENESQNAKRMRMGLEPLPATSMISHATIITAQSPSNGPSTASQPQTQAAAASAPLSAQAVANNNNSSTSNNNAGTPSNGGASSLPSPRGAINVAVTPAASDFLRHAAAPPPPTFRTAPEFSPSFFTNGHGTAAAAALFRPGFPGYQHPAHQHPAILPQAQITANTGTANGEFGPTDLSMKKSNSKGQLSPSEIAAIKQLIAGYKESASFLYRSADELEQLLLQQN